MKDGWYYYFDGNQTVGPLDSVEILRRIQQGIIGPYQMMFLDEKGEWAPALTFSEFREGFNTSKSRSPVSKWVLMSKRGKSLNVRPDGPFTMDEVKTRILDGRINYDDYAWTEGMARWRRIGSLKEFSPNERSFPKVEPTSETLFQPKGSKQEMLREVEHVERRTVSQQKEEKPPEAAGEDLTQSLPIRTNLRKSDSLKTEPVKTVPPLQEPDIPAAIKFGKLRWIQLGLSVLLFSLVLFHWVAQEYKDVEGPPPVIPQPPQVSESDVDPTPQAPPAPPPPSTPEARGDDSPSENELPKSRHIKAKPHPATRMKIIVNTKNSNAVAVKIETDASPDQTILIDIVGPPGMVLDRSHLYRKKHWQSNRPLDLGNELRSGFYRIYARTGDIVAQENFEIGTRNKDFAERLKATRKQFSYDYWTERKNLLLTARLVGKLAAHLPRTAKELHKMSRFQPSDFIFSDLWLELKDICDSERYDADRAKERIAALQTKIAQMSLWK